MWYFWIHQGQMLEVSWISFWFKKGKSGPPSYVNVVYTQLSFPYMSQ